MLTEFGRTLDASEFVGTFSQIFRDVEDKCQVVYGSLQAHMKEPWSRQPLKVCIVDNDELNALAYADEGCAHVTVFRGAIERIYGACLSLFSTKSFLPSIGNPHGELDAVELEEGWLPRMPLLRTDGEERPIRVLIPNDQARMLAAFTIAEAAVEFLLFHEIGHIVGGHVDMNPRNVCHHSHFGMPATIGSARPDPQMCECDADAFAGFTSSTVTMMQPIDDKFFAKFESPTWTSKELHFLIFIAAVGVLFRVLDRDALAELNSYTSVHPHPAVRCCFVVSNAFARAIHSGSLSVHSALNLSFEVIRNIEVVWASLMLPGKRVLDPKTFADRVGDGMWDLFWRNQAQRDEFAKYARIRRSWCDWEPTLKHEYKKT